MIICFWTCGAVNARHVTVSPDLKKDLASGSSIYPQIWHLGKMKPGLWVGNANLFNHKYRALLRFDIRRFIIAGKVKKAVLEFSVPGIYGVANERKFELQCFTVDKVLLSPNDLADSRVKTVKDFILNKKMKYPKTITIDVSSEINSALYKGFGSCTFRLRDTMVEKYGNPHHTGCGTAINQNSVKLYIIK